MALCTATDYSIHLWLLHQSQRRLLISFLATMRFPSLEFPLLERLRHKSSQKTIQMIQSYQGSRNSSSHSFTAAIIKEYGLSSGSNNGQAPSHKSFEKQTSGFQNQSQCNSSNTTSKILIILYLSQNPTVVHRGRIFVL